MPRQIMKLFAPALCAFLLLGPALALAHAFPKQSDPAAGATVSEAPTEVRIRFNGYLSPLFDRLTVTDASGKVVSGDAAVDEHDPALLTVPLKPLAPGTYHVHWQVTSKDGHRSEGNYTFTVSDH